jgi:hypothetical protein
MFSQINSVMRAGYLRRLRILAKNADHSSGHGDDLRYLENIYSRNRATDLEYNPTTRGLGKTFLVCEYEFVRVCALFSFHPVDFSSAPPKTQYTRALSQAHSLQDTLVHMSTPRIVCDTACVIRWLCISFIDVIPRGYPLRAIKRVHLNRLRYHPLDPHCGILQPVFNSSGGSSWLRGNFSYPI